MASVRNVSMVAMLLFGLVGQWSTLLAADEQPHMLNESFIIPAKDIPQLENEALRGSGAAAYRLSQYHFFITLDGQAGFRWLQVAAEDGNPTAEYSLAARLSERGAAEDKIRACFWLARAKDRGSKETNDLTALLLSELGNICKSQ